MDTQSLWQYVSQLRPSLRAHTHLYPQVYRGERWYVLHDESSGQYLRFNERAYSILGRFDGDLTLEEILEFANNSHGEYPLSKDEIAALIAQLNAAELLRCALPINTQDVFRQYKNQKSKKTQSKMLNPFSIKFSFLDPDKFLNKLAPISRALFSKVGIWIWSIIVIFASLLGLINFEAIYADVSNMEFSPTQLITLWLLYPIIKAFHEIGHGLAIKAFGGESHEAGINLLLFMPVPYIDATASWGFRDKWRRMLVGSAGILTELFIAAIALFLYLNIEPGLVKELLLNIILIATVSTLLFNANPLLRYDGYFILEDWLEIPNLATRSKRYYYYLIQNYILGLENIHTPATAEGEEKWFLVYGFLSPIYRLFVLLGITIYLADSFLIVGLVLGIWIVTMQLILPLGKAILFLSTNRVVAPKRIRGVALIVVILLSIVGVLLIPISTFTYTQGVVLSQNGSEIVAKTAGIVEKILVKPGADIVRNQVVAQLRDIELEAKEKELTSHINELKIELIYQQRRSIVKAQMVKKDMDALKSELKMVLEKIEQLKIRSHGDGKFVLNDSRVLEGRYISQGEVIAYLLNKDDLIIQAVVNQARIGLLESYETSVDFKLASNLQQSFSGKIIRQTPQATQRVSSALFGVNGGGNLAVDSDDASGEKLMQAVFVIDISLPESLKIEHIGSRVYVRLYHGDLTIAQQLALYFNQLFLTHFYSK